MSLYTDQFHFFFSFFLWFLWSVRFFNLLCNVLRSKSNCVRCVRRERGEIKFRDKIIREWFEPVPIWRRIGRGEKKRIVNIFLASRGYPPDGVRLILWLYGFNFMKLSLLDSRRFFFFFFSFFIRFAESIPDLFETSRPLSVPILLQNIINKQSSKPIV